MSASGAAPCAGSGATSSARRAAPPALAGALLLAGLLLAVAARGAGPLPGDLFLARVVQRVVPAGGAPHAVLGAAADAIWLLPLVVLAVALPRRRWKAALLVLVAAAGAVALGEGLLPGLVARPRPAAALLRVDAALPADNYGFPSGTALYALVVLGLAGCLAWRSGAPRWVRLGVAALSCLLVVLIGVARVAAGAHWPTDVLGGWLFGGAWLLALLAAARLYPAGPARNHPLARS